MKKFKLAALGGTAISSAALGTAGLQTAGLVSAGLIGAAGVAMMPESAQAQTISTPSPATFARESFPSANQVAPNSVTLAFSSSTLTSATGDVVTFRLSNGATFSGAPTIASSTTSLVSGSGSLSGDSTAVSYTITTGNTSGTLTLSGFTLLNVGSRLATATTNAITIAASSTNSTFSTGSTTATLASSTASTFFASTGSVITVDVANGGLGRVFRVSGANQSFATIGTVALSNTASGVPLRTPDNINTLTLSSSDTASFTLTGDFTSIASTYLTTSSCAATPPSGALTGTIAGSSASYSALTTTATYNVCVVANGTSVINGNSNTFSPSAAVSFGGRSTAPGGASYTPAFISSASTAALLVAGPLTYNGTVANFNFYFGTTGSYTQFLNVANSTTSSATVLVVARPTTGATSGTQTTSSGTLDTALGIGASRLYSSTDVSNALNGNVFNGVKGTITVLVSTTGASISNVVLNPNGGINNLQ